LAGNQSDLRELLYEICREQCESLGMTRSEFFQAADGAAVEWTVALLNELESHLDSQQLRKLKSALNRQQAALTSFAKERAKFRRRRSALEARIG
jgi:phage-related protein